MKGQARLIRLPPLKRNGFTMRFGGNITSVIGKPFGATKNRRRKGTVHLSGRWRSHVIECENSLRKLGAKHKGASPARNRSELAGECVAKRQAHLGESGNSAAMPDTARFARPSGSV